MGKSKKECEVTKDTKKEKKDKEKSKKKSKAEEILEDVIDAKEAFEMTSAADRKSVV